MISSPHSARAFSKYFNPLQPSVAFHAENSRLIYTANQVTGFYMKCNTGLKWFNVISKCMQLNVERISDIKEKQVQVQSLLLCKGSVSTT